MRLGIDVDGVLANFNDGFIDRIIQVTGRNLFPSRPFDIPCWDYPEYFNYTKQDTHNVWESIKADRLFWRSLNPYFGVISFLDRLSGFDDDIYFITSRPGIQAKTQTETWLRHNGYAGYPTVLISSEKGLCAKALNLDRYIDDKWENCVDVVQTSPTTRTYLLTRPWNTQCDSSRICRVSSLNDMLT